jgi:hypothetical protein
MHQRIFTCAHIFSVALILAVIPNMSVLAFEHQCLHAVVESITAPYQKQKGMTFVPKDPITYRSFASSSETRLTDVMLTLDPNDDLEKMAKILSQGKPHQHILATLETHAKNGEPLPLRTVLPQFPKKMTNTHSKCDGPNCFNAVLNWYDPKTGLKLTKDYELVAALSDPTRFKKIQPGEELRLGDIMVISTRIKFANRKNIQHAAVYLDDDLVWHKASSRSQDPWTFESLESAISSYYRQFPENLEVEFYRAVTP